MRDPAEVIKDLLVAAGIGTFAASSGWGIFLGDPPDTPDSVIMVNQTGGLTPYPHLLVNEPSVQVFVRSARNGYQTARAKIGEVVVTLLGRGDYTDPTSGDKYHSFLQIGEIAYLGRDDNARSLFSANFRLIVEPVEAGSHRVAIT